MLTWRRLLACQLDTRVESCARRGRKRRDESRRGSLRGRLRGCATGCWATIITMVRTASSAAVAVCVVLVIGLAAATAIVLRPEQPASLAFVHRNSPTAQKYLIETMGG